MFEYTVFETKFCTPERETTERINLQSELILTNSLLLQFFDSISQMLVVLNKNRQIIYANKNFTNTLGFFQPTAYIGKRPGEAVNCAHAYQSKGGCGTTEFCRKCGAANAILESQQGIQSVKECRILTRNNDALDFKITATPVTIQIEEFTVFEINDISHEKRRQILERLFFHDFLNSSCGIAGLSDLIGFVNDHKEMEEIAGMIQTSAKNLISDIQSQRQISAAERGDLELNYVESNSFKLLKEIAELYSKHEVTGDKCISIEKESENFQFETDVLLLRRIIGNMTKNALEASLPGSIISLKAQKKDGNIIFTVHNPGYIDQDTQLQLFNRSFTTKGSGRGLGTYSMKLFGEKYLNGKVWFETSKENGTTFLIRL